MDNHNTSQIKEAIKYHNKWEFWIKITASFTLLLGGVLYASGWLFRDILLNDPSSPLQFIPIWLLQLSQIIGVLLVISGIFICPIPFVMFLVYVRKLKNLIKNNSVDTLSPFLNDKDSGIRKTAVENIAYTDGKRAIPYLESALNDENEEVRKTAKGLLDYLKQKYKNNDN